MRRTIQAAVAVVMCTLLLGCAPTEKEKKVIEELTANMKSICMGRYVMNVPEDARIDGDVKLYYGLDESFKTVDVSIESLDSTVASMRTMIDAKADEIDKDDKNWETKGSMLIEYRVIDDHTLYLRQYYEWTSAAGSKHELHVLVGKTQLVLTAKSYEGVPEAGRYQPGGKVEEPEVVAARLVKVARTMHAYDVAEKAGPGYCLGPVVINSGQDEEEGNTYMFVDRYLDLRFSIYNKGLTPDNPSDQLAQRVKRVAGFSAIQVFRNREIMLGGMKGHESLVQMTDYNHDGITLFKFVAESIRADPALVRAHININFDTGGQLTRGPDEGEYVSSSLTRNEAAALWDAMISSIRVRPNALGPTGNGSATSD